MFSHGPVMLTGLERLERRLIDDPRVTGDALLLGLVLARAVVLNDPTPPPWDLAELGTRVFGGSRAAALRRAIGSLDDDNAVAGLQDVLGADIVDRKALTAAATINLPVSQPPRLTVVKGTPQAPADPHGARHG